MSKIAIITDTDSSLSADVAHSYNIQLVPIGINFGDESFTTGVDIDDARLFDRVNRLGKLPTTAAPTPEHFLRAYQQAFDGGAEALICYCISAKMSATYSAAVLAREMLPDREIEVVDTNSVSLGQGYMALAAADIIRAGGSMADALEASQSIGRRALLFGALATLKYLVLGGRLSRLQGNMADFLDIRPVLTLNDGRLEMLERTRTHKKAVSRLIELMSNALNGRSFEKLGIVHTDCLEEAEALAEKVRAALPCPTEIMISEFTPGLSVHTGPGMLGLLGVPKD